MKLLVFTEMLTTWTKQQNFAHVQSFTQEQNSTYRFKNRA